MTASPGTQDNLGFTVWFTGPPAAGKSTLASLLTKALGDVGRPVVMLNGELTRARLWPELGFTDQERNQSLERMGFLCKMLNDLGTISVVAAIAPFEETRRAMRSWLGEYVEIYCHCPQQQRQDRDAKGLYAEAASGRLSGLTGYDAPYEEPQEPELVLDTDQETPEESAKRVLSWLAQMDYLGDAASGGYDQGQEQTVIDRLKELGYL